MKKQRVIIEPGDDGYRHAPGWITIAILAVCVTFCVAMSAIIGHGVVDTAINGPLPPTRYGPLNLSLAGMFWLFIPTLVSYTLASDNRYCWKYSYLVVALIPAAIFLVMILLAIVSM